MKSNLDAFLSALWPGSTRILWCKLAPLTLGHTLLLWRLGCPFLDGSRPAGLGDLLLGLSLCSRPFPAAHRLLHGRWMPALQRLYGVRASFYTAGQLADAIEQFHGYIAAGFNSPELWSNPAGSGRELGGAYLHQLRLAQLSWLHKSEAEAMATPLRLCIWDSCVWAEMQGKMRLVTATDRRMFKMIEEMRKEMKPCQH